MTCAKLRQIYRIAPEAVGLAVRVAMTNHYTSCPACEEWSDAANARSTRKLTPAEEARLDKVLSQDDAVIERLLKELDKEIP